MSHSYVLGKFEGEVIANRHHGVSDEPYAYIYEEKC